MENLLFVSGTRPEIIKLAPLYHAIEASPWARAQWLHTGQHGKMSQQILSCFDIVPDITLRRAGSTLSEFSVGCRQQLDAVMTLQPWSAVIVQGDTNEVRPHSSLDYLTPLEFKATWAASPTEGRSPAPPARADHEEQERSHGHTRLTGAILQ